MHPNFLPEPTTLGIDKTLGHVVALGGPRPGIYMFQKSVFVVF